MSKKLIIALALLVSAGSLAAQENAESDKDVQYVTDQLRLSLYSNADQSSNVIRLLQSGDALEIEQLQGPYALVTTADGTRGWVKRGFLVPKPTANLLLDEERQRTQALQAEIEKLSNSKVVLDQYEQDMTAMSEQIASLEAANSESQQKIAELQEEIEARQQELERRESDQRPAYEVLADDFIRYWHFMVPIVIVIILISFLVSKQIVETRIKARFHGIKIW